MTERRNKGSAPRELDLSELASRYLDKSTDALEVEEMRVLRQIGTKRPTSRDAADVAAEQASVGERLADRVAAAGGSWGFIIAFALTLFFWMLLNGGVLAHWSMVFDPYPYIFLNLILSMLAAIQAPIIMMSQNRQAAKDRVAASLDFEVNLRAEIEILRLHSKIDEAIVARLEAISRRQEAILDALATQGPPAGGPPAEGVDQLPR